MPAQRPRNTKEAFDRFLERHERRKYAAVFLSTLERMVDDGANFCQRERIIALAILTSWGNQKADYPDTCTDQDGSPMTPAKFGARLGIDRQRYNEHFQALADSEYLVYNRRSVRLVADRAEFAQLVASGQIKKPKNVRSNVRYVPDNFTISSPTFRLFAERILEAHPDQKRKRDSGLQKRREGDQDIKEVDLWLLNLYKKAHPDEAPDNQRPERQPPPAEAPAEPAAGADFEAMHAAVVRIAARHQMHEPARAPLVRGLVETLRGIPDAPAHLEQAAEDKHERLRTLGILRNFAEDIAENWRQGNETRARAESAAAAAEQESAERATVEMDYEDFCRREVQRKIASDYPDERLESLLREHLAKLKTEHAAWFQRTPDQTRREVALARFESALRASLKLPTLEEWITQHHDDH